MPQARMHTQSDSTTPLNPWTLGDRLRKARRLAGLQANELAEQIGVSTNTVSNAENDRGEVTRRTLVGWAWATGIDISWLEHGDQPEEGEVTRGRVNRREPRRSSTPGAYSGWSMDKPKFVRLHLVGGYTSPQGVQVPVRGTLVPVEGVHTLRGNRTIVDQDVVVALREAR